MKPKIIQITFLLTMFFAFTVNAAEVSYEYDSSGRLIGITYDGQSVISYTYDAVGNRLMEVTDADGDGLPDDYELAQGFNPNDASDANDDTDVDGLTNLAEYNLGTSPNNPDTDGDGVYDGFDGSPLDNQQSSCPEPVKNYITNDVFSTIQAAIDAPNTADNDVIKITGANFVEDILYGRNITLTLSGGYYCSYSNNPSTSSIKSLDISDGTVIIENLEIY